MAAPKKSIDSSSVAFSENNPGTLISANANPAPRMNGATIPAAETEAALRARLRNVSVSNSTPTRNM